MNKEIIRKITTNKKFLYMLIVLILVVITATLNVAFSAFTSSTKKETHNLKLKQISYEILSKKVLEEEYLKKEMYTVKSGVSYIDLKIENQYHLDLKYELDYDICTDKTCDSFLEGLSGFNVHFIEDLDNYNGVIESKEAKEIRILFDNNKSFDVYLKFKINSGFTHNELELKNKITNYSDNLLLFDLLSNKESLKKVDNNYFFIGDHSLSNHLIYSNIKWRIVKINNDESIKLLYNGSCADNICDVDEFRVDDYKIVKYNSKMDDVKYIGLTYDENASESYEDILKGTLNSEIMNELNLFYDTNLKDSDVVVDSPFCSNREITNTDKDTGFGNLNTEFTSASRLSVLKKASLYCNEKDIYSVNNNKLANPIGLLTADEIFLAGIDLQSENESYLNLDVPYFTMTPYNYLNNVASVFVLENQKLVSKPVDNSFGNEVYLRPVINLKKDIKVSGDGSSENPYLILAN